MDNVKLGLRDQLMLRYITEERRMVSDVMSDCMKIDIYMTQREAIESLRRLEYNGLIERNSHGEVWRL